MITQKLIKLNLVMVFLFFSLNGFGVDINFDNVVDCYAEDTATHALYRGAAMLNNTLPISCDSYPEQSISRDTKLKALRVAIVRKDKDGYNVIEHNNVVINEPPGSIKDYLPGNINSNQWLKKHLGYKLRDGDTIRVSSHYVSYISSFDTNLSDVSDGQPKKNVHSIGYRPIQRPKDSRSTAVYCQYRNTPPVIIYKKDICKQSNEKANYICSSPVVCIKNGGVKVETHAICLVNQDSSCPSATECAAIGSGGVSVNVVYSTTYDKINKRFRNKWLSWGFKGKERRRPFIPVYSIQDSGQ